MKVRDSFTSSSEALNYLRAVLVCCVATMLTICAFSWLMIRNDLPPSTLSRLYAYQLRKIESGAPIDILLVGDSSLGNSVDARQWTATLGRPVVSVALTGVHGLPGSLNMIRRAVRRHAISTVVIMHTADMMTRRQRPRSYLLTAESWADIREMPVADIVRAVANFDVALDLVRAIVSPAPTPAERRLTDTDYVAQGRPLAQIATEPTAPIQVAQLDSSNKRYLTEIGRECRAAQITCIYMHGPYVASLCRRSTEYLQRALDWAEAAGLNVVRDTVCVPWDELGDADDHVAPPLKGVYSRRILDLVRPLFPPPDAGRLSEPGSDRGTPGRSSGVFHRDATMVTERHGTP